MKSTTSLLISALVANSAFPAENDSRKEHEELRKRALTGATLSQPIDQLVGTSLGHEELHVKREKLPYKSIRLVRSPCFGECPVFTLEISRSGEARLNAEMHMPELGLFTGVVDSTTYARLCLALDRLKFRDLKDSYRATWTDSSTCYVTATFDGGEKTVEDYGKVGPIELWVFQQLLDSIRLQIEWKRAPESAAPEKNSRARP